MLSQLLKAEMAEREVRSIACHTKVARFPSYMDLAGFDFASSDINEATVRQLHRGEFIENAENVVLIGGPGTGKSHIATAICVQAIEHHRRKVRFYSTVELVNALEQEKALGKAGKMAEMLTKIDLIILDELGYLPFSPSGGALLFHLLSNLYERTSVVIGAVRPDAYDCVVLPSLVQGSHVFLLKIIVFQSKLGSSFQRPSGNSEFRDCALWDFCKFETISWWQTVRFALPHKRPARLLSIVDFEPTLPITLCPLYAD